MRKTCLYTEDFLLTNFSGYHGNVLPVVANGELNLAELSLGIDQSSNATLQQSTFDFARRILGSWDNMRAIADEFFTGTH